MKLSKLIKQAQAIMDKHGDLEVFTEDYFKVSRVQLEVADSLDPDWKMPDGFKFVIITA